MHSKNPAGKNIFPKSVAFTRDRLQDHHTKRHLQVLEDDDEWLHWLQVRHRGFFWFPKSRRFWWHTLNFIYGHHGGSKKKCIKSVELSGHTEDWKMVLRVGVFSTLEFSLPTLIHEDIISMATLSNEDDETGCWHMMIPDVFVVELLNQNNWTKRDICEHRLSRRMPVYFSECFFVRRSIS